MFSNYKSSPLRTARSRCGGRPIFHERSGPIIIYLRSFSANPVSVLIVFWYPMVWRKSPLQSIKTCKTWVQILQPYRRIGHARGLKLHRLVLLQMILLKLPWLLRLVCLLPGIITRVMKHVKFSMTPMCLLQICIDWTGSSSRPLNLGS